jgi:hypothetical protein
VIAIGEEGLISLEEHGEKRGSNCIENQYNMNIQYFLL